MALNSLLSLYLNRHNHLDAPHRSSMMKATPKVARRRPHLKSQSARDRRFSHHSHTSPLQLNWNGDGRKKMKVLRAKKSMACSNWWAKRRSNTSFLPSLLRSTSVKGQKIAFQKERRNIVFQGNPGTGKGSHLLFLTITITDIPKGKTTVARIYASYLFNSGCLSGAKVVETSGAKLAAEGPSAAKDMIDYLASNGGVLFVDEAYQLVSDHSMTAGRQILDIILTEMENHIGRLVIIFAGYNTEMESFFEHNPGLVSRVPYTLQFTDFNEAELWTILRDNIDRKYQGRMKIEDGMDGLYMRIVVRRLARCRGTKGFGNARQVENLLARIAERQAVRIWKERRSNMDPDYYLFTKEDLLGPDPSVAKFESEAWKKLQSLIGLDEVKKAVEDMIGMIETNYRRDLAEKHPLQFSLNRVFVGSPGTGKTTVAKLYGRILADLGLLSNGEGKGRRFLLF